MIYLKKSDMYKNKSTQLSDSATWMLESIRSPASDDSELSAECSQFPSRWQHHVFLYAV